LPKLDERPRTLPPAVRYADHQVITPPTLRHAIADSVAGDEPVLRAEHALASLAQKFPVWMQAEWARLAFAYAEVSAEGFAPESTARLLRIAYDIRGNAPLYGFAEVAELAESLCRLIEEAPTLGAIPRMLVGRHVDAIGCAAKRRLRIDPAELRRAVTQHLLRQSSVAIAAPSLAPA
jgi:hypothetical protein